MFDNDKNKAFEILAAWRDPKYRELLKEISSDFIPPGLLDKNYVPPDYSNSLLWLCVTSAVLAGFFTCGRLMSRRIGNVGWNKEDYMLMISLMNCIGFTVVQALSLKVGAMGRHIYDVFPHEVINTFAIVFAHQVTYPLAICFTKLSMLLFYLRLQPGPKMKLVIYGFLAYWGFFLLIVELIFFVQCKPISAAWDLILRIATTDEREARSGVITTATSGNCADTVAMWYSISTIQVVGDFILLVMPIGMLWDLRKKMSTLQVLRVALMFGLGGVAWGAEIAKTYYAGRAFKGFDFTWDTVPYIVAAQLECTLAIICVCIPSMCPYLIKAFAEMRMILQRFTGLIPRISVGRPFKAGMGRNVWTEQKSWNGTYDSFKIDKGSYDIEEKEKYLRSNTVNRVVVYERVGGSNGPSDRALKLELGLPRSEFDHLESLPAVPKPTEDVFGRHLDRPKSLSLVGHARSQRVIAHTRNHSCPAKPSMVYVKNTSSFPILSFSAPYEPDINPSRTFKGAPKTDTPRPAHHTRSSSLPTRSTNSPAHISSTDMPRPQSRKHANQDTLQSSESTLIRKFSSETHKTPVPRALFRTCPPDMDLEKYSYSEFLNRVFSIRLSAVELPPTPPPKDEKRLRKLSMGGPLLPPSPVYAEISIGFSPTTAHRPER